MRKFSAALLGAATAATLAFAGVAVAQSDDDGPPPPGMSDDGSMDNGPMAGGPMGGAMGGQHHRMHRELPGQGPETRAQAAERADRLFALLDVNGDGVINSADRDALVAKEFAKLDTNGDGVISLDEFKAAHQPRPERGPHEWGQGRRGGPDGGQGAPEGAPRGPEGHGPRMGWGGHGGPGGAGGLTMLDRLLEKKPGGQITAAEFKAEALARFDKLDANHDGVVTPEERKAAMQQRQDHWKDRADRAGEGQ